MFLRLKPVYYRVFFLLPVSYKIEETLSWQVTNSGLPFISRKYASGFFDRTSIIFRLRMICLFDHLVPCVYLLVCILHQSFVPPNVSKVIIYLQILFLQIILLNKYKTIQWLLPSKDNKDEIYKISGFFDRTLIIFRLHMIYLFNILVACVHLFLCMINQSCVSSYISKFFIEAIFIDHPFK